MAATTLFPCKSQDSRTHITPIKLHQLPIASFPTRILHSDPLSRTRNCRINWPNDNIILLRHRSTSGTAIQHKRQLNSLFRYKPVTINQLPQRLHAGKWKLLITSLWNQKSKAIGETNIDYGQTKAPGFGLDMGSGRTWLSMYHTIVITVKFQVLVSKLPPDHAYVYQILDMLALKLRDNEVSYLRLLVPKANNRLQVQIKVALGGREKTGQDPRIENSEDCDDSSRAFENNTITKTTFDTPHFDDSGKLEDMAIAHQSELSYPYQQLCWPSELNPSPVGSENKEYQSLDVFSMIDPLAVESLIDFCWRVA